MSPWGPHCIANVVTCLSSSRIGVLPLRSSASVTISRVCAGTSFAFVVVSVWCGRLWSVGAAEIFRNHLCIPGMLPAEHEGGIFLGVGAGFRLCRHPHGAWPTVGSGSLSPALGLVSPALGNASEITYSSVRTCRDRYRPWISGATKTVAFVVSEFTSTVRNAAPTMSMGCLFIATILCFVLTRFCSSYPDL